MKTGSRLPRRRPRAAVHLFDCLLSDLPPGAAPQLGPGMAISGHAAFIGRRSACPLQMPTDFLQILEPAPRSLQRLCPRHETPHFSNRYEGFDEDVCKTSSSWTRKTLKGSNPMYLAIGRMRWCLPGSTIFADTRVWWKHRALGAGDEDMAAICSTTADRSRERKTFGR